MKNFTKYLIISFLAIVLGLIYYVSSVGMGLAKLTNTQLRAQAEKEQVGADSLGHRRRYRSFGGGRSYVRGISVRGGGSRFGK